MLKALKSHRDVDGVMEYSCWILGNIIAPLEELPVDIFAASGSYDHLDSPKVREASVKASATPNSRAVYRSAAYWDLLQEILQSNYQKELQAKWVCCAVR